MKKLNSLWLGALVVALMSFGFSSCKKKCKSEPPRARIVNNGTGKASVQIFTSDGNTENINNVLVGSESDWRNFASGVITFTIDIQNEPNSIVVSDTLVECTEYDIIIDANNNVTSVPTIREYK